MYIHAVNKFNQSKITQQKTKIETKKESDLHF